MDSKCVEVVIFDIAAQDTATSASISANIKTLVSDIQKRNDNEKPNIIITPTSAAIASESIYIYIYDDITIKYIKL